MVTFKKQLLCYIDYLGFSDLLKRVDIHCESDLLGGLLSLFRMTKSFISKSNEIPLGVTVPEKVRHLIPEPRKYDFESTQISDAIIITHEVNEDNFCEVLYFLVQIVGVLQITLMTRGPAEFKRLIGSELMPRPLIRGAVTYGDHYSTDGGQFIVSRALIEAYEIERSIHAPSVVISEGVMDRFLASPDIFQLLLPGYLLLETGRVGRLPFVNYLKRCDASINLQHKQAIMYNTKYARKLRSQPRVFEKLRWLMQFHNHIIGEESPDLLFRDDLKDTEFRDYDVPDDVAERLRIFLSNKSKK